MEKRLDYGIKYKALSALEIRLQLEVRSFGAIGSRKSWYPDYLVFYNFTNSIGWVSSLKSKKLWVKRPNSDIKNHQSVKQFKIEVNVVSSGKNQVWEF